MSNYYIPVRTDDAPRCILNEGVICDPSQHTCDICGWNPVVAKARLEKICNDLGIQMPENTEEEM